MSEPVLPAGARERFAALLGPRNYLDRPEDLKLYEYDGGVDKHPPLMVVFPRTTQDVSHIVKLAREYGLPIVGRGAGTGLSGGAIPREGGIMIAFARMNRILEIDLENERAVVQPGVVNLDITLAVEGSGYFYAPDPSSQRACTIGGNVAENAGGPHTLAYGVTTNHVLGLEMVLPDGSIVETGGKECAHQKTSQPFLGCGQARQRPMMGRATRPPIPQYTGSPRDPPHKTFSQVFYEGHSHRAWAQTVDTRLVGRVFILTAGPVFPSPIHVAFPGPVGPRFPVAQLLYFSFLCRGAGFQCDLTGFFFAVFF